MARAWLLNLDAEVELRKPKGYQSSVPLLQQMARREEQLSWLTQDDEVWDGVRAVGEHEEAICWCPTPSALRQWRRAGKLLRAPSLEVLQRVNNRKRLLAFDDAELEREFVTRDSCLDWLEDGRPYRLKRAHGFAGRGQRVLRGSLTVDDRRWVTDSARDGFLRESEVSVQQEWCLHGYLDEAGVLWGDPCRQVTDAYGRVTGLFATTLEVELLHALERGAKAVCQMLAHEGYWGPFGIDAFTFARDGTIGFNPVSDINARFTLGWSIGMGSSRGPALARLSRRACAS